MTRTDVLVVGAGPTGLALACDLARRGAAVRIIDREPEFPRGSRGKGLSPRTLEVFDDLGVVGPLLKYGLTHLPHRKYRGPEVVAEIDPEAGRVVTPDIPYNLIGPGGLIDDAGHVARAYGQDALILIRPDGYIALIANADDTPAVAGYLRSL